MQCHYFVSNNRTLSSKLGCTKLSFFESSDITQVERLLGNCVEVYLPRFLSFQLFIFFNSVTNCNFRLHIRSVETVSEGSKNVLSEFLEHVLESPKLKKCIMMFNRRLYSTQMFLIKFCYVSISGKISSFPPPPPPITQNFGSNQNLNFYFLRIAFDFVHEKYTILIKLC